MTFRCRLGLVLALTAGWVQPALVPAAEPADRAGGTLPVAADGKPLNLDFETGTLAGWTAEGDAFAGQPVEGDTVAPRRPGQRSAHQGRFWVGGYEKAGDDATGTLTSDPFKVTAQWASFLVAGGTWPDTRVELLTAADGKVFFTARGTEAEMLRPVVVDLEKQFGQLIRVRLVDGRKGPWGHVNFDDFRFHAAKPTIPDAIVPAAPPAPADTIQFAGLSPQDAAKAMTLPRGFKSQVFAAEPQIVNPIAFAIDARGRLWVAQSFTYPIRAPEGQGRDSILIFEDTDGDGVADKRTVFAEHLNLVSGLEVGFGGVYVGAAPYLMFIPAKDDASGETKAAGEPQVLLDGFGYQDTHETLNSFVWGPDGWLYGCHGVFTNSFVGKPGTPKDQRVHLNAGVWRFHPTRKVFERFAEGTSNPWGLDYDDKGQFFAAACVIPHLWHVIQNARYQRQAGQHDNPYTFNDIKQSADHVHYQGATPHAGNGRSDAAGGGHAHSGLMIYDGDNWPAEYRGKLFMNNIHGARINMDVPEPSGSGYVVHHGKDFLLANDRGSQIINMKVGPDGSVYMIDWYDLQQCHTTNPKDHDRTTGRIFKVSYGEPKPVKADLEKLSDAQHLEMQKHPNGWQARTARRVLREREGPADSLPRLAGILRADAVGERLWRESNGDERFRLRLVWAGVVPTATDGKAGGLDTVGDVSSPYIQSVYIQNTFKPDRPSDSPLYDMLAFGAKNAGSPVVRLAYASGLPQTPVEKRWEVLAGLLSHAEDATDHNLPMMYWYGLESVMSADPDRALSLAAGTKIPNLLTFAARRQAMIGGPKELDGVTALLGKTSADAARADILRGMAAGLKGRRGVPAPAAWDDVTTSLAKSADADVARLVQTLGVVFGSKAALADSTKVILDRSAPAADRLSALDALLAAKA
ncbi:MAG: putative rane-bound dehydrogenase, partial [Phycisphaerales bacterium]|nr:putative rane-bound dehydrogenase [Phycisphaerales bacterium]